MVISYSNDVNVFQTHLELVNKLFPQFERLGKYNGIIKFIFATENIEIAVKNWDCQVVLLS